METPERLEVYYDGRYVGSMAPYRRYLTAFEYSRDWLRDGFSLSPFSLPLEPGVKIAKADPFDGLFGIFADSLPDGWGRLLVDRMLRREGVRPEEADPMTRLSIVGSSGMGGLEYKPVYSRKKAETVKNLDYLAEECRKILQSEESEDLDTLFALGGSSGGARPKVMLTLDDGEWIVKFPSAGDPENIGQMEYDYHLCAKACGIDIPEIRLFPSDRCSGYFGSRRFDRITNGKGVRKLHMASASALLEVSHRIPALDYTSLMALTWQLTKEADEIRNMFTLMCFNVFAHNRDDHSNNFSFLCDGGVWRLAPAYDLTWSSSMGGEHATTIAGEGKNPGMRDILQVAKRAGIKETQAKQIAERVADIVQEQLAYYIGH